MPEAVTIPSEQWQALSRHPQCTSGCTKIEHRDCAPLPQQTCHLVRIVRIQYGFLPFLRWYGRITLWYGFEAKYWKTIYELCVAKQNSLSPTQIAFSVNFRKTGDDDWPVVNQRRRPNPTVAPCDLKLRCWFFAAMSRFFCKLVWYGMNRVNVFAIHRCINEGYGLIWIFTEKIRISPTKLWRVCTNTKSTYIQWQKNLPPRMEKHSSGITDLLPLFTGCSRLWDALVMSCNCDCIGRHVLECMRMI